MSGLSGSGDGAKRLGGKLLEEVEVEELTSVLKSLHELKVKKDESSTNATTKQNGYFNIQPLDAILHPGPPILELVSPPQTHHPSSAGKTSLLYLIIATAVLPASFSSTKLGGHDAAIVLLDPLSYFSVSRLSSVMLDLLFSKLEVTGKIISDGMKADMRGVVKRSLVHVHIFRPRSWSAYLSTLRSLPEYLFDGTRHKSMHRRIHSIILEDIDAFVWGIRSSMTNSHPTSNQNSLSTASAHLTTQLSKLSALLSCATILTSHSSSSNSFRPHIPTQWPQGAQVTRLAVRRIEVLKFPPVMSMREAEGERQQRWDVVQRARFEAWRVGVGVRDGEGFVFRIGERGVEIEQDEQGGR